MKDRIQEYMDQKKINAGELAQLLDVQRSNISHILNGRNKPSATFIEKMLTVFPDLNARWLLTGQGPMFEGKVLEETIKAPSEKEVQEKPKADKPKEKEVKELKEDKQKTDDASKSELLDDTVDNVVLLFRDGSFKSFKKR